MRRIPFVLFFFFFCCTFLGSRWPSARESCGRAICGLSVGTPRTPQGQKKKETKGPESRKRVKIDGVSFFTTQQPTHLRLRGLWQNQLSERVVHPRVHVLRTGPQKTKKGRHARLPTTGNMTAFHRPTHDRTHAHRKGRAKVALMQAGINRSAEPAACGDGQA